MSEFHLYLRYLGISLRSQLQYRASFLLQTFGHLLVTAIEFLAIWILFDRFERLHDWTLPEVAVFYGFVNISFSFADAFARGFDVFGNTVRLGDFDRMLLRPRTTIMQLAGQELTLKRAGRLLQGLLVLLWGFHTLGLTVTPDRLALSVLVLAGSISLFVGLVIIQATIAFWTVETLELMNSLTYGGVHAAQYPLSIYSTWLRRFFTLVVPLAATAYYPVVAILGRPDPLQPPAWLPWISPLAGFAFLGLSLLFWRLGVRHYTSTGS